MFEPELSKSILNDDWLSESNIPDPSPLPKIPGYRLLIRPVPIRSKTKGGILLPDKAKDDMKYLTTVGRVLAVGDLATPILTSSPVVLGASRETMFVMVSIQVLSFYIRVSD